MKILLATDGSESAHAATEFLIGFPLPKHAEITVTTVIKEILPDEKILHLSEERRQAFEAARAAAETEATTLLEAEAQALKAAGLAAEARIEVGSPAEAIVRLATDLAIDIIVVGSHGLSGPKRFMLGSVSDRVYEYAPCSVLIVKPCPGAEAGTPDYPKAGEPWRILLAFDDSPPARKAVELCGSLPLAGGSKVKALSVMPMIRMYRQDIRQQLSWVWQEKKEAAEKALQWVDAQIDGKDIEVSTELLEDADVAQALLDAAADFGSDLVIIGHKSKTAFERFLLGSVTARIAHHSPCSVLSVRTDQ
jgi:nucleotide-binding universal stress UspA family protein